MLDLITTWIVLCMVANFVIAEVIIRSIKSKPVAIFNSIDLLSIETLQLMRAEVFCLGLVFILPALDWKLSENQSFVLAWTTTWFARTFANSISLVPALRYLHVLQIGFAFKSSDFKF